MAQTTIELRHLLQMNDFKLFDFDYRLDDENYKKELEQAIIDHYYFYEIGQETPDLFKHRFKTRFKRIIGYYNKLYNTTLLEYNPLINSKMTEALEQLAQTDNNTEVEQTSSQESNSKGSDYPQQPIAGGDYLSDENTTTSTDQTGATTISNTTNNTSYSKTIEGLTGTSYQELIQKERKNILRITSMIIEELKPCFILVH